MSEESSNSQVDFHDPLEKQDYLSLQHLERYRFACAESRGPRVLDIACGSGYGTAMLAQSGFDVVGADVDVGRVEEARGRWPGVQFEQGDVLNLDWDDDSFDTVVSFETLEHVVDGERFMSEMRRVIKPGGRLICSTPNIGFTAHPPFHVKEYEPEEFFRLVEANFASVRRYAQVFRWRDRALDLYNWHWPDRLWFVKKWVSRMGFPRHASGVEPGGDAAEAGRGPSSDVYRVQPLASERLVRIMVVVATMDAD